MPRLFLSLSPKLSYCKTYWKIPCQAQLVIITHRTVLISSLNAHCLIGLVTEIQTNMLQQQSTWQYNVLVGIIVKIFHLVFFFFFFYLCLFCVFSAYAMMPVSICLSVCLWRLCTVVTGCNRSRISLHAWIDACLCYLLTTPHPDRRMGWCQDFWWKRGVWKIGNCSDIT